MAIYKTALAFLLLLACQAKSWNVMLITILKNIHLWPTLCRKRTTKRYRQYVPEHFFEKFELIFFKTESGDVYLPNFQDLKIGDCPGTTKHGSLTPLYDDNRMKNSSSFIPFYDFSPSLNAGYLKEIVPLIMRHNIPANPINYAICYDYVAGNNITLAQAINVILAEQGTLDCDTSMGLYKKYICNASLESFEKINEKIHKVIEQATNAINETCHKAEETNDSFQKKSVILENISETSGLRTILQEIIKETQSLAVTSHAMQVKLIDANQEMEQLRTELDHVRKIATTDGLTGLLNRRAFDIALAEVVEQSESQEAYLSLLDIDHFKRINDSYGHIIGDNVIKYVASLMKKHAEDHHIIARYGGEELAIIMPNTCEETAIDICEHIRIAMESARLQRKNDNQPLGSITLSIGIAKLGSDDDLEGFIVRADKALYKAKQTGRNKVVYDSHHSYS